MNTTTSGIMGLHSKWISDIVNIPLHFFFTKSFKLLVLMYHSIVFV